MEHFPSCPTRKEDKASMAAVTQLCFPTRTQALLGNGRADTRQAKQKYPVSLRLDRVSISWEFLSCVGQNGGTFSPMQGLREVHLTMEEGETGRWCLSRTWMILG